jgi:hypothetical protein
LKNTFRIYRSGGLTRKLPSPGMMKPCAPSGNVTSRVAQSFQYLILRTFNKIPAGIVVSSCSPLHLSSPLPTKTGTFEFAKTVCFRSLRTSHPHEASNIITPIIAIAKMAPTKKLAMFFISLFPQGPLAQPDSALSVSVDVPNVVKPSSDKSIIEAPRISIDQCHSVRDAIDHPAIILNP